jgi:hypothetical protein
MSIPLDRLYQHITGLAEQTYGGPVIIYRFWPHGSKNPFDLQPLRSMPWLDSMTQPYVFCNDQEPLEHDYYAHNIKEQHNDWRNLTTQIGMYQRPPNLYYAPNMFGTALLIHSELNSRNVDLYSSAGLIPVYYWSHAIIARDWFRYAQHIDFDSRPRQHFLIYNRAWSGTREYRLRFAEMLVQSGLAADCMMTVNCQEPELGIHYRDHEFRVPEYCPKIDLSKHFDVNRSSSCYSADFSADDYQHSEIEIVLETLYHDDRWHLTEKILRPIACGHPFMALTTPGSLGYLRSYGFQTFADCWPEDYDHIHDHSKRMAEVVAVMQWWQQLPALDRAQRLRRARDIAKINREYFFSKNFSDHVISELQHNLVLAWQAFDRQVNIEPCRQRWAQISQNAQAQEFLTQAQDIFYPTKSAVDSLLALLAQPYRRPINTVN